MKNGVKKRIIKKMVEKVKKQACETVGRSWPTIMHEVEIPIELKTFVEKYERTK